MKIFRQGKYPKSYCYFLMKEVLRKIGKTLTLFLYVGTPFATSLHLKSTLTSHQSSWLFQLFSDLISIALTYHVDNIIHYRSYNPPFFHKS